MKQLSVKLTSLLSLILSFALVGCAPANQIDASNSNEVLSSFESVSLKAKQPRLPASQGEACIFNGKTIAHGGNVYGYKTASVPPGKQCLGEWRECNNGYLTNLTFTFASCTAGIIDNEPLPTPTPRPPASQPKACLFNGKTIAHGGNVYAYKAASVPAGQRCLGEWRECHDGYLTNLSFTFSSCTAGTTPEQPLPTPTPQPTATPVPPSPSPSPTATPAPEPTATPSPTPTPELPAPVISDIQIFELSSDFIQLSWKTDIVATSQAVVHNEVTGEIYLTVIDETLVTDHMIMISGLMPDTPYRIVIISVRDDGTTSASGITSVRTLP